MQVGQVSDPENPKMVGNLHRALLLLRGRRVTVETAIGNKRSGKMTAIFTNKIVIGGTVYEQPMEIEFDNDTSDRVDVNQLIKIDLLDSAQ